MKRLIIINLILTMILCIIPKETKTHENVVVNITHEVEQVANRSLTETRQEQTPNEVKQSIATEISQEGIDLIKRFERL